MRRALTFVAGHLRLMIEIVLVGAAAAVLGHAWLSPAPAPAVTHPTANTTSVDLAGPITSKVVTAYLPDPASQAAAQAALAEVQKLQATVTQLTAALATNRSTGEGTFAPAPLESVPAPLRPAPPAPDSGLRTPVYRFNDGRLDFVAQDDHAKYALTQRFRILATTGRKADGSPLTLVKLFEVMPDGKDRAIDEVTSTSLFADETRPRWLLGVHVQGGLAYTVGLEADRTSALVGIQWLTHGRTRAAADTGFAVATPAILVGGGPVRWAVLPVSVNIAAHVRHQPFENLWLSPVVGPHRVGLALSATF